MEFGTDYSKRGGERYRANRWSRTQSMYVAEPVLDVSTARGIFERNANCAQPRELGTDYSNLKRNSKSVDTLPHISLPKPHEKSDKVTIDSHNARIKSATLGREIKTPFTTQRVHGMQRGVWGYSSLGHCPKSWKTDRNASARPYKTEDNIQPAGTGVQSNTQEWEAVTPFTSSVEDRTCFQARMARARSNTYGSQASPRTHPDVLIDGTPINDVKSTDPKCTDRELPLPISSSEPCTKRDGGTHNDGEIPNYTDTSSSTRDDLSNSMHKNYGKAGWTLRARSNTCGSTFFPRTQPNAKIGKRNDIDTIEINTNPSIHQYRIRSFSTDGSTNNDRVVMGDGCNELDSELPESEQTFDWSRWHSMRRKKTSANTPAETHDVTQCIQPHNRSDGTPASGIQSPLNPFTERDRQKSRLSSTCSSEYVKSTDPEFTDPRPLSARYKTREEGTHSDDEQPVYMDMSSSTQHDSLPISMHRNNGRACWTLPRVGGSTIYENTGQSVSNSNRSSLRSCGILNFHDGVHEETVSSQSKDYDSDEQEYYIQMARPRELKVAIDEDGISNGEENKDNQNRTVRTPTRCAPPEVDDIFKYNYAYEETHPSAPSEQREAGTAVQYCENCSHRACNSEDPAKCSGACQTPVQSDKTPRYLTSSKAGRPELWRDRSIVVKGRVLDDMTEREKKIQECLYEVIKTEDEFYKNINVLIYNFMEDITINDVVDNRDRSTLFSNIKSIRDVSKCFLTEMESAITNHAMIGFDICDIIRHHCEQKFDVYISYIGGHQLQSQTLKELEEKNREFKQALRRIHQLSDCRNLPLQSFIMLPIQRVTRIPLMMNTLLDTMGDSDDNSLRVKAAYTASKKLAEKCNRSAKLWQTIESVSNIEKNLVFPNYRRIYIMTKDRRLVKSGQLTQVHLTNGSISKKNACNLFVFNDVVLITKKKSKDDKYEVIDHLENENSGVDIMGEETLMNRLRTGASSPKSEKQFLVLTKPGIPSLNYFFTAKTVTDLIRWKESLQEPPLEEEMSSFRREIRAKFRYVAKEPDEMSLSCNDLVEVYRELGDGWSEGYNLNRGERGWFPVSLSNIYTKSP